MVEIRDIDRTTPPQAIAKAANKIAPPSTDPPRMSLLVYNRYDDFIFLSETAESPTLDIPTQTPREIRATLDALGTFGFLF